MYIPPGIPQKELSASWQQPPVGYPVREKLESFFASLSEELTQYELRLADLKSRYCRLKEREEAVSPIEAETLPPASSLTEMELSTDRFGWRLPVTSKVAWNRKGVLALTASNGFPGETHTLVGGRLISRGLSLASIVQGGSEPFLVEAIHVPEEIITRFGQAPFRYQEGISWNVPDPLLWAEFRLTLEVPIKANSFRLFLGEHTELTRVVITTAQGDRLTPPVLCGFAGFPDVLVAAVEFRLESSVAHQTEVGFWVGELQLPGGGLARERLLREIPAPSLVELGYTMDFSGQIVPPTSISPVGDPTKKPTVEAPLQAVFISAPAERREIALLGLELGREEYAERASAIWRAGEFTRGFGRIQLRYLPAPGHAGVELFVRHPGESVGLPVLPGEEFTVRAGELEVVMTLFRDPQLPTSTPILQALEVEHLATF